MAKSTRLKCVVRWSSPQKSEFARRSDGVLFARWYDRRGSYGYGWTKWRRANEQECAAVAGDPEHFTYGFFGPSQRYTDGCSSIRLPQD